MSTSPSLRQTLPWILAVAGIAFAVPALFSTGLRWERMVFLVADVGVMGVVLAVYFRRHPLSWKQWLGPWPRAVPWAALACFGRPWCRR